MANIIKPKRSYTLTNTPTLASGELGINAASPAKIWIGNAAGTGNTLIGSLSSDDMVEGSTNLFNKTHTGDATGSTALTVVKINGVALSGLATGLLKNTTTTGVPSIATAGTDYVVPSGNITGTAAGLSATLAVGSGGTGLTTLTANNVILGNGTSAPTFVAPGTSGNLLTSNGTTWQSTTPAASSSLPTGALMPYAGSAAPSGGYLLCDGSSVSSSTYLALHAVISNTYGGSAYTGAAGLSFNLPDLRGRLPMGAGTGTGLNASGTGAPTGTAQTARTRGQWLGEETHALTIAELASHTHANTVSGGSTSTAGGSHNHQIGTNIFLRYVGSGGNRGDYQTNPNSWTGTANNDGVTTASTNIDHSHTFTPSITNVAAGSGTRHDTIPPVVVLNYIIKT